MATCRCLFKCSPVTNEGDGVATSKSRRWADLCRDPVVERSSQLLLLQPAPRSSVSAAPGARLCMEEQVFWLTVFFPRNLIVEWQQESAGGQAQSRSLESQTSR